MITREQLTTILSNIEFLNLRFELDSFVKSTFKYKIRIIGTMPDNDDRSKVDEMTSFVFIPIYETTNEIDFVKAVYQGVIKRLTHEASEIFKFNGQAIFNEHWNISEEKKVSIIKEIFATSNHQQTQPPS